MTFFTFNKRSKYQHITPIRSQIQDSKPQENIWAGMQRQNTGRGYAVPKCFSQYEGADLDRRSKLDAGIKTMKEIRCRSPEEVIKDSEFVDPRYKSSYEFSQFELDNVRLGHTLQKAEKVYMKLPPVDNSLINEEEIIKGPVKTIKEVLGEVEPSKPFIERSYYSVSEFAKFELERGPTLQRANQILKMYEDEEVLVEAKAADWLCEVWSINKTCSCDIDV